MKVRRHDQAAAMTVRQDDQVLAELWSGHDLDADLTGALA
jgi:hypothetical protein